MAATGSNATMAGQLANALAQALQSSGMFYESHLSGLAFGKQSPAHLMQEPQAMLGRSTSQSGQSGAASSGSGTAGATAAGSTALAHSSATAMSAGVDAAASTA
jgi:hypothetical protein